MECKYPEVTHGTAYKRGCRCGGCTAHKKALNKKSRSTDWDSRSPGMKARYPVPVEPILKHLDEWIDRIGRENPIRYEFLGKELGRSGDSAWRMYTRYKTGESKYMSFEMADRIISALYGPHYWYENEELLAIYEEHA